MQQNMFRLFFLMIQKNDLIFEVLKEIKTAIHVRRETLSQQGMTGRAVLLCKKRISCR